MSRKQKYANHSPLKPGKSSERGFGCAKHLFLVLDGSISSISITYTKLDTIRFNQTLDQTFLKQHKTKHQNIQI